MLETKWQTVDIKQITKLLKDGSHGTHSDVIDGIPLLSAKDINNGTICTDNDPRRISLEEFEAIHKNYSIQNGDILLTIVGSIGRIAQVKNYKNNFTLQRSVAIIRFKESALNDFMYYLMVGGDFYKELRKRENKGAQGGVYLGEIGKISVNLPPIDEQKYIVGVLKTWDQYLELIDNKLSLKRALKKGLAKRLISGDVRVSGFSNSWGSAKLGDIATIKRGGSPRPIDSYFTNSDSGLNWLKIGDIKLGSRYIARTAQKIKPEGLSKTTMVHEGDFILSNSMSFGRPYIMKISACIHDGWLALMDINPNVNKSFLFYMLSSNKIQGKFKALSAGSGVQNLKKETVATVEIQLPSVEEQTAIAKILHDADDEIELLVEERKLIAAQRDYLIHNLVTGKLRLSATKADSRETTYA